MLNNVLFSLFFVFYPAVVFWCLQTGNIAWAALFLAALGLLRWLMKPGALTLAVALSACVLAGVSFFCSARLPLKFYPVVVSSVFFVSFFTSLFSVPAVERFARLRHAQLPDYALAHCRRATIAWCCFFVLNGAVALDSALWRSDAWWALYNGVLSYVFIALMFALEWLVRRSVQKRFR